MNTLKNKVMKNKLLTLVILAYIGLFIFIPDKAIASLQNSLYYVKEMLTIMPVILLLTSLISAWVSREAIERNFGKSSGIKGSIYSFLLGSFSAGPIYAAFPVCKALLQKGASISNIVVILSTWAVIKVPMLLNEAKFLGPKFMALRWILTTISIFIMGFISSKFITKGDIPEDEDINMPQDKPLYIDKDYCIGCGVCAHIAPNNFYMDSKKAKIMDQNINPEDKKGIQEAVKKCPPGAIKYNDVSI